MIKDMINQKKNLQSQLEETIQMSNQQKIRMNELQKQIEKLVEEREFLRKVNGQINANVKNGLIINAQIKLTMKELSLDSTRSKYIVSTSDQEALGIEAYEKGEPITSLQMNTNDFICKPGTYYIRCIVFDSQGKCVELLSNPVRTSGSSVSFCYEGKPTTISLIEGQYKLEVWGAKGGDSTGTKSNSSAPGHGGLGGYSCGILTLHKNEKIHVYVGGEGRPADSSESSISNGGFPDGGGTKTGHCKSYTSVPGTGGGSTSIRVAKDTDYTRLIVAGGGGGASGSSLLTNDGGFGGGTNGGNSQYWNKEPIRGSGPQTGSTHGVGYGSDGNKGSFGKGAEGKYLSGRDSGGGGGGGWYGGGSGGYGQPNAPGSGGGGSGWIFTEDNYNIWKSGDCNNSSKYDLNSSYYLDDPVIKSGEDEIPKPDGNGTEHGHSGNGYAKITPL